MTNSSMISAAATARLQPPGLTIARVATASFARSPSVAPTGRYLARFIEFIVFPMLLALIALSGPAGAQTVTISSVAATPATVRPGQTAVFTATITASQNLSNYPVLFSLLPPGASASNAMQQGYLDTFKAGVALVQTDSWTVPAGAPAGTYTMTISLHNPAWSIQLAQTTVTLTVAAAAPTDLEPPVVSGTAQVGKVLASTTGTWTGATSYAYQWAGNGTNIPRATAATYTPVSTDAGHTLTSTVTAIGSSGGTASATSAPTVPIMGVTSPPPPNGVAFTALHTYFISPTGSDSNDGTSSSSPWLTANHAVNCGDVIIAAPGEYSSTNGINPFGTVSNCPSTSGGIDGTGGVYFAVVLCGSTLMSCDVSYKGAVSSWPFQVTKSHWAVEGFSTHGFTNGSRGGFVADGSAGTVSYVAFVNDIAYNVGIGFGGLDNGTSHDVPGATGFDYVANVGDIAQNAEQNTVCTAAMSWAGPASVDNKAGTHFFMYGNFAYNQTNNGCDTDIEDFMFDTWDAHGVTNQSVMLNNIGWSSYRYGAQIYMQNYNSVTGLHDYVYNNTLYNNNLINSSGNGEINIQMDNSTAPYISVLNNIGRATQANECGLLWGGHYGPSSMVNVTVGVTGHENVGFAATSGYYRCVYNGAPTGVNFNQNPAFNNTSDLLANQTGVPNCTGFTNVTACMGWNAGTSVLTNPSVIYDLTPTCTDCTTESSAPGSFPAAGAGYQRPSVACVSSGFTLYPIWLKGIVYLQWNGSSLTENSDLVTKPCNM